MFPKSSFKKIVNTQKGFSLIEILIALTLIGLMGTFAATKFFQQYEEGQIKSTKIQMNSVSTLLKEYRRKCNRYPTTEQGLDALASKPSSGRECKDYPPGGFIDGGEVPVDPWDNDFSYESNGKTFNLFSYGADGEEGGEETDADIYLRRKK